MTPIKMLIASFTKWDITNATKLYKVVLLVVLRTQRTGTSITIYHGTTLAAKIFVSALITSEPIVANAAATALLAVLATQRLVRVDVLAAFTTVFQTNSSHCHFRSLYLAFSTFFQHHQILTVHRIKIQR